ncbi:MAG: hypothetical protein JRH20_33015 [Deltaproteobacteria bacterium]|nr:hypothetical protein [Deltaproteobacteria bacterium]
MKVARIIMELHGHASDYRAKKCKDPWKKHRKEIIQECHAQRDDYLLRLEALSIAAATADWPRWQVPWKFSLHLPRKSRCRVTAEQPLGRDPLASFPQETARWGLDIRGSGIGRKAWERTRNEHIITIQRGEYNLGDYDPIGVNLGRGKHGIAAISSRLVEMLADDNEALVTECARGSRSNPLVIADMGHHQYGYHYCLHSLRRVHVAAEKKGAERASVILAFWRWRNGSTKDPWAHPLPPNDWWNMKRHNVAWEGHDLVDYVDVFSI